MPTLPHAPLQADAVKVLLKEKAQVDVRSHDGNNPLLMAAYNGQLTMVTELLNQVRTEGRRHSARGLS